MNYKDIERIAELEECSNLEFKESTGQLDRSMETLCAFLNGDGGHPLSEAHEKNIAPHIASKFKEILYI